MAYVVPTRHDGNECRGPSPLSCRAASGLHGPHGFRLSGRPADHIQRKARPASLPAPSREVEGYRGPRTGDEIALCQIFADVLELKRVGIDDNFFTLGGQSLLAARVIGLVRAHFGVEVSIRTLFERHGRRTRDPGGRGEACRAPLVRQPRPERLPLSLRSSGCGSSTA